MGKNKKWERLPKKVIIKNGIIDRYTSDAIGNCVSEYLTEKFGFCHNGFDYTIKIVVENIDWDMEDK